MGTFFNKLLGEEMSRTPGGQDYSIDERQDASLTPTAATDHEPSRSQAAAYF
jgi:hypothetical protein